MGGEDPHCIKQKEGPLSSLCPLPRALMGNWTEPTSADANGERHGGRLNAGEDIESVTITGA